MVARNQTEMKGGVKFGKTDLKSGIIRYIQRSVTQKPRDPPEKRQHRYVPPRRVGGWGADTELNCGSRAVSRCGETWGYPSQHAGVNARAVLVGLYSRVGFANRAK